MASPRSSTASLARSPSGFINRAFNVGCLEPSSLQHWDIPWGVPCSSWRRGWDRVAMLVLPTSRCWQHHGGRLPSWRTSRGKILVRIPPWNQTCCQNSLLISPVPPCSRGYHFLLLGLRVRTGASLPDRQPHIQIHPKADGPTLSTRSWYPTHVQASQRQRHNHDSSGTC